MSPKIKVEHSTGNVFDDLGLSSPDERLAKAKIAHLISQTIQKRRLTQTATGELLGLAQPKVSDLVRGKLEKFSTERLLRYAKKLDYDVLITLTPKRKAQKQVKLRVKVSA